MNVPWRTFQVNRSSTTVKRCSSLTVTPSAVVTRKRYRKVVLGSTDPTSTTVAMN